MSDQENESRSKLALSPADWVQVLSSTVLIFGLFLVIYELKQTRDIAEAQFTTEDAFDSLGIETAVMGENAAVVIAKACEQPQDLTKADGEVMVAWLRSRLARAIRAVRTDQEGLLAIDPSQVVELAARFYLGTEYGRFEWEKVGEIGRFDAQFPMISKRFGEIHESYSKNPVGWCSWGEDQAEYLARFSEG